MNQNKGIIGLGLILAIVLGVAVIGGGAYYLRKSSSNVSSYMPDKDCGFNGEKCLDGKDKNLQQADQTKTVIDNNQEIKNTNPISSSEESSTETFKDQPGEIKSIKADGTNKWILAVDLLSHNPKWFPGGDDPNGEFFINQNTKIRDLNITNITKSYKCGNSADGNMIPVLTNTSDFIEKIKSDSYKNRYFDIVGANITAIYEQCLP